MGRRVVVEPTGLGDVQALLDLLTNKDAYAAKVKELSDLVVEAKKAAEALGIVGDVEAERVRAQSDRHSAREHLSMAQSEANRIIEAAKDGIAKAKAELAEGRARLTQDQEELARRNHDLDEQTAMHAKSFNKQRDALQVETEALAKAKADLVKREQALAVRTAELEAALAKVRI
jgi:hypothetical protein